MRYALVIATALALAGCGGTTTLIHEAQCKRFESADGEVLFVCPGQATTPQSVAQHAAAPQTAAPRHAVTVPPGALPYRYVRIDDVSNPGDAVDAGADIDAIILDKANGERHYASRLEAFKHGGGFNPPEVDPEAVLGKPNDFSRWEEGETVCRIDGAGSPALGGTSGMLIVGFEVAIEPGDRLTVLEVGGCTGNDGPEGIPDDIEVSVSVANQASSQWTSVVSGAGPIISGTVPTLPVIPTH